MADGVRVPQSEIGALLKWVLAISPREPAPDTSVSGFEAYLLATKATASGWLKGDATAPAAAIVAVHLPGDTTILLVPFPEAAPIDCEAQGALLRTALRDIAATRPYFVQALVEDDAAGKARLLGEHGFAGITSLRYLDRSVTFPWAEPAPEYLAWQSYAAETHRLFVDTIAATYTDSLDCPELTGLRPMEAVIAAHKASGVFDPELWQICLKDGEPAGVVLLAPLAEQPTVEVVYTGVTPAFRRQGIGGALLRRTISTARDLQTRRLTVVVDSRNAPARQLYERFGFELLGVREAYLLTRAQLEARFADGDTDGCTA